MATSPRLCRTERVTPGARLTVTSVPQCRRARSRRRPVCMWPAGVQPPFRPGPVQPARVAVHGASAARMKRIAKWLLAIVGVLVLLLAIGVGVLVTFDWNGAKPWVT